MSQKLMALRTQIEKLDDEAIVDYFDENASELAELLTEDAELAEKVNAAYDRLQARMAEEANEQVKEAVEVKTAKTEDQANLERREKIAGIFESKGYDEAAVAIKMDLDGQDARTLNEIVRTLDRDIPDAGLYGWAVHWAYVHRNSAKNVLNSMSEATAIKLFVWLSAVLSRALRALDSLKNARSESFKEGLVRQAREHLVDANGIRFQGWALAALERLMESEGNPISDLFVSDKEIAGTVFAAPQGRRAVALLNALKERVERQLAVVHFGPMRQGKTERDNTCGEDAKKAIRRARQLERAQHCKSMRGSNPGVEKHGKKQR